MTKAKRFNTGKLRMDLLPPEPIEALAEILTKGAEKYGDRDWELGMDYMTVYASLMRHLLAWQKGIDKDEESGLHHLKHILANAAFLVTYTERGVGVDNRPITVNKTK